MAAWIRLLDRHRLLHAAGIAALGVVVATGGGTTITPVRVLVGLALSAVLVAWFRTVIMPAALRTVDDPPTDGG